MPEAGPRNYPSWIDRFVEATSGSEAPEPFRRWAAIVGIGATLQQSVWMQTKKSKLFPNLYAFLVGPPGVGKSETVKAIRPYLEEVQVNLSPTSVTGASLVDEMAEAKIEYVTQGLGGEHIVYYSMLLMPDELNALMNEYDGRLVGMMTTFYDVGHYSETRRSTGKNVSLTAPQLSILAGTTPSHLLNTLPDRAWEEGFMSRTIIIYTGAAKREGDIFENAKDSFDRQLMGDLNSISNLSGQCSIDDSYRNAYAKWRGADLEPAPTHPRLRTYCSRREAHLLKLSMVACVDGGDTLHLEAPHFDRAHTWLTEAESCMPHVFNSVISATGRAIDEAMYRMNGHTMPEGKLGRYLMDNKVAPTQIKSTIDFMVSSGSLIVVGVDENKMRIFKVKAPKGSTA